MKSRLFQSIRWLTVMLVSAVVFISIAILLPYFLLSSTMSLPALYLSFPVATFCTLTCVYKLAPAAKAVAARKTSITIVLLTAFAWIPMLFLAETDARDVSDVAIYFMLTTSSVLALTLVSIFFFDHIRGLAGVALFWRNSESQKTTVDRSVSISTIWSIWKWLAIAIAVFAGLGIGEYIASVLWALWSSILADPVVISGAEAIISRERLIGQQAAKTMCYLATSALLSLSLISILAPSNDYRAIRAGAVLFVFSDFIFRILSSTISASDLLLHGWLAVSSAVVAAWLVSGWVLFLNDRRELTNPSL